jgi:amino acid adenylation domain-containing protein
MKNFLVQHAFDNIAIKYRDKVALYFQNENVTYGDLFHYCNQLANCLIRNGVRRGDRVLLILDRSINSIKGMIAVLKVDAIYIPLGKDTFPARFAEIFKDCTPSAIICDNSTLEKTSTFLTTITYKPRILVLDSNEGEKCSKEEIICQKEISLEVKDPPAYSNIDQDLAYIIYTSGTNGKPKGVMVSHQNILNYINWAIDYFEISEKDNILSTSPFHFDMSVFDIYGALMSGAALEIASRQTLLYPIRIVNIIESRKISIWKAVSSLFAYFVKVKALKPDRMNSLQKIIFSGEPLPPKYLIELMKSYQDKSFYNAYGPTECTGISTIYEVENIPTDVNEPIPIGKACANTEIFALNEDGSKSEIGEVAELYIKSSSLSCGYWNDRIKTNQAFVSNPLNQAFEEKVYRTGDLVKKMPDGNYVFIGRKDDQIKNMGYRIELGEIDFALQSIHLVNDAATIAVNIPGKDGLQIISYIETTNSVDFDLIWHKLDQKLPKYMIPNKIKTINSFPRSENGKIDKILLKNSYIKSNNDIALA